jgi:hypothetical protein
MASFTDVPQSQRIPGDLVDARERWEKADENADEKAGENSGNVAQTAENDDGEAN